MFDDVSHQGPWPQIYCTNSTGCEEQDRTSKRRPHALILSTDK